MGISPQSTQRIAEIEVDVFSTITLCEAALSAVKKRISKSLFPYLS